MFRETNEEEFGASAEVADRAAGLRPQPLRVFAEQHPSRAPNPVAEILEKAACLIEPPGSWLQGACVANDGAWPLTYQNATSFCLFGAVRSAIVRSHRDDLLADTFAVLDEVQPQWICWNDRLGRTQAEVVSKLREAAQLAREQSQ